jgi:hypothetical protein
METTKLIIEIELTGTEAAALDRYIEEGCYDRNRLFKRELLRMIAAPGTPWQPAPAPSWSRTTTTSGYPGPATTCVTSGYMDVEADRRDLRPLRADHQRPTQMTKAEQNHLDLQRAFRMADEAARRGLPADPAIFV